MTRGNNRNTIFRFGEDYQYFLELIKKYKAEHPFDLYHYCLMPSHIHLLVQTKKALDFSIFIKRLNLAYLHHYKREYGWIGHFWQGRYKSKAVGKDAYFIQCGKYIELNPVRAGIVKEPENYQYSSYRYYSEGVPDHIITPDFIFEDMGKNDSERQRRYRELVIDQVVKESYNKDVWGGDQQRYREKDKVNRKLNKV